MRSEIILFLLAVQFLTRLPVPISAEFSPERLAASVRYYPLVGALIGTISAAIYGLTLYVWPPAIALILSIAAGLLVTGAFHEDGLADTFDGIGGGHSKERALEIMRDSRLGTYGTAVLIVAFGVKFTALSLFDAGTTVIAFIVAHCLSRMSAVVVIRTSTYVREEGTGKPVARGLPNGGLAFAMLSTIAVALSLMWLHPGALIAVGLGMGAGHLLARLFFERKIGGYTGDTLGAVQQFSEIGIYLGLAAWV